MTTNGTSESLITQAPIIEQQLAAESNEIKEPETEKEKENEETAAHPTENGVVEATEENKAENDIQVEKPNNLEGEPHKEVVENETTPNEAKESEEIKNEPTDLKEEPAVENKIDDSGGGSGGEKRASNDDENEENVKRVKLEEEENNSENTKEEAKEENTKETPPNDQQVNEAAQINQEDQTNKPVSEETEAKKEPEASQVATSTTPVTTQPVVTKSPVVATPPATRPSLNPYVKYHNTYSNTAALGLHHNPRHTNPYLAYGGLLAGQSPYAGLAGLGAGAIRFPGGSPYASLPSTAFIQSAAAAAAVAAQPQLNVFAGQPQQPVFLCRGPNGKNFLCFI